MPDGGESIQRTRAQPPRRRPEERKGAAPQSGAQRAAETKRATSQRGFEAQKAKAAGPQASRKSEDPSRQAQDSAAKASGFLALAPTAVLPMPSPIFPALPTRGAGGEGGLFDKAHSMATFTAASQPSQDRRVEEERRIDEPNDSNPFRGESTLKSPFPNATVYRVSVKKLKPNQKQNIEQFNQRLKQTQRHPHLLLDLERLGMLNNELLVNVTHQGETSAAGVYQSGKRVMLGYLNGIPDDIDAPDEEWSVIGAGNINRALMNSEGPSIPTSDGLTAKYTEAALKLIKAEVAQAIHDGRKVKMAGRNHVKSFSPPKYLVTPPELEKLRKQYNQTLPDEFRLRWLAARSIDSIRKLRSAESGVVPLGHSPRIREAYEQYARHQLQPVPVREEDAWNEEMSFDDNNPFRGRDSFWIHEDRTVVYDAPVHALNDAEAEEVGRIQNRLDPKSARVFRELMAKSANGFHVLVPVSNDGSSKGLGLVRYEGDDVQVAYVGGFDNGDANIVGAALRYFSEAGANRAPFIMEPHQVDVFLANWHNGLDKWKTWKWHTMSRA